MPPLSGLIPPLCTPLTAAGEVDAESLTALLNHQLDAGVDGVFVLGSSGEAAYLDARRRQQVVQVAAATVAGRVPLLVGALDTVANRVIDQLDGITEAADAVVVTAPFYANCSNAEIEAHFRAIAAACPLPLLAYDIPSNVGRRLDVSVSARLLQDGVLAGLKDSSGTLDDLRRLIMWLGPDREAVLLTGVDALADVALSIGADGLIPGLANARPGFFTGLLEANRAGDRAKVAAYQEAIIDLTAIFGIGQRHGTGRHASELGALKHVMVRDGVIATAQVSAPMSPYPQAAVDELHELVAAIDLRLQQRLAALSAAESTGSATR